MERVDLNVSVNENFRIERNLQRCTNLKVGFCLCAGCCNKVFLRMIVEIGSSSGILSNGFVKRKGPGPKGTVSLTKTYTVIPFWNQTISSGTQNNNSSENIAFLSNSLVEKFQSMMRVYGFDRDYIYIVKYLHIYILYKCIRDLRT